MVFGKSDQQRDEEEQARLRSLLDNPPRWWAWYPVKVETGEWVWWEDVECVYDIMQDYHTGYLTLWSTKFKYRRIGSE